MIDRELRDAFLVEGRELAARAGDDVATLARDGADSAALDSLFRSLHTLKGSAGLFDLPVLSRLLHAAESRLQASRAAGETAAAGDDLTAALDLVEAWLDAFEQDRTLAPRLLSDTAALTGRLEAAGGAQPMAGWEPSAASPEGAPAWALPLLETAGAAGAEIAVRYRPSPEAYFRGDDPLAVMRGLPELRALTAALTEAAAAEAAASDKPYDPFRCRLDLRALCGATEPQVREALRLVADQVEIVRLRPRAPLLETGALAAQTVRVSAARLDGAAALVDELVIAKNALDHAAGRVAAAAGESALVRELGQRQASLERIVADLHSAVTDLRLVGLRGLFARFPRHARELAARLGKAVDFAVEGGEVVLDKSVVETLYEPVLHLLRNAVDHGLETPEVRAEHGKPPRAQLKLSARRSGDAVVIEVADDGRGIDTAAVRAAAAARGLLTAQAAEALSEAEAARLVFAAGFSTVRDVGELSGRGVGMDVVSSTVQGLGGRVELDNRPGRGLTVALVLPARVVLARVLVVEVAGQRFGVPLEAVAETHRVRRDEVTAIRAGRAFVRRDTVIPVLRLRALLGLPEAPDPPAFPVLQLAGAGEPRGVQVDALGERMDAPLRPLSGLLSGYPGMLGSILQGNGEVLLVLDLEELAA
jgi:two-component system chemotaxis sensor kinase CheA